MEHLLELSKPFPDNLVQQLPGKGKADYVAHGLISQRLLEVLGPYSFEVVQVIDAETVLCRLTVEVDLVPVVITEVGRSDNQQDALKSAASDGLKRCARHIGLGLHLWCDQYWLHKSLTSREEGEA